MRRAAAPAAAVACLAAVNLLAPHLPEPRTWGQIAGLALVSFPLAALVVAALLPFATTPAAGRSPSRPRGRSPSPGS